MKCEICQEEQASIALYACNKCYPKSWVRTPIQVHIKLAQNVNYHTALALSNAAVAAVNHYLLKEDK